MSMWLKPENQWLGLSDDTLANFVFEKAKHTWATRVLWEKLHWNTRCQHFNKRRCKHCNKAIPANSTKSTTPHSHTERWVQLSCQIPIQYSMLLRSKGTKLIESKWDKYILVLLLVRELFLKNASLYFSALWKSKEIRSMEIPWTHTVTNRGARSTEGHATMSGTSGCKWRLRMSGWQERFGSI